MITVDLSDPSAQPKRAEIEALMDADYIRTIENCPADKQAPNVICKKVSASYGDSIKTDALKNAVSTIRERINEKGVAEPSVFTKDDEIVVELPGLDKDKIADTRELIARTAKLEMKVVDDCAIDVPEGCTAGAATHDGSPYMKRVFARIHGDPKKGVKPDQLAEELQITAEVDGWRPEDGGVNHTDFYLKAHDREESMTVDQAKHFGLFMMKAVPSS
jgi:preprotein translocase subunit SecD